MKTLLDTIRLPDFTRVQWTRPAAQPDLARRIKACVALHKRLELESVDHGLRRCAILLVPLRDHFDLAETAARRGLALAEVSQMALGEGYSSERLDLRSPATVAMYAVGRGRDAEALASAYNHEDHETVAGLLGYPTCCARFFQSVWQDQGLIDTLWPMALNTEGLSWADESASVPFHPSCNMFLKSIGLRRVFHLPCSCQCRATIAVAGRLNALAAEIDGDAGTVASLDGFLSASLAWTAHHGVSIVDAEELSVVTKTDFGREVRRLRAVCDAGSKARQTSRAAELLDGPDGP